MVLTFSIKHIPSALILVLYASQNCIILFRCLQLACTCVSLSLVASTLSYPAFDLFAAEYLFASCPTQTMFCPFVLLSVSLQKALLSATFISVNSSLFLLHIACMCNLFLVFSSSNRDVTCTSMSLRPRCSMFFQSSSRILSLPLFFVFSVFPHFHRLKSSTSWPF